MHKKINESDFIGKKYNKLTILEFVGRNTNSCRLVKVICDCGTEKVVPLYLILSGEIKSCGCSKYGSRSRLEDFVGKKYGKLTIEDIIFENGKTKAVCVCDCGKRITTLLVSLKTGKSISCGCSRNKIKEEDFIGKKFGNLTILSFIRENRKPLECECICDCGNKTIKKFSTIQNGVNKNCGCLKRQHKLKYDPKDFIGKKFGRATVVKALNEKRSHDELVECVCDCGNTFITKLGCLRRGESRSCGCYGRERVAKRNGLAAKYKRIYHIYNGMIYRCTKDGYDLAGRYKARGISVCQEWLESFENFLEWSLKNGYKDDLSIDRIDNDGNYSPDNCRWTDEHLQTINQRTRCDNKSGYKGVTYRPRDNCWCARIRVYNKPVWIGQYKTKKEALDARNKYILDNNLTEYPIQEWRDEYE